MAGSMTPGGGRDNRRKPPTRPIAHFSLHGKGAGGTVARGYGRAHQVRRAREAVVVDRGEAFCARCGLWISPGEPWDLGHDPLDRSRYLGAMHRRCNRDTRFEKSLRRPSGRRPRPEDWL
jgi:hypothetical protein